MRVVFSTSTLTLSAFSFLVTLLLCVLTSHVTAFQNMIHTQPSYSSYSFAKRMVSENNNNRMVLYSKKNINMKLHQNLYTTTTAITCNNRMHFNNIYNRNSNRRTRSISVFAGHGHGHGGMMGGGDPNSFVQTELRKEAMRLHTKDQAKEGEQEAQTPFTKWIPERKDYVHFLVDSRHVYRKFEEIVNAKEELKSFRNTGLERAKALDLDLKWFQETYPNEIKEIPPVGKV